MSGAHILEPYLCIKPACGDQCSGCNCAISPQKMRDYAIAYAAHAPLTAAQIANLASDAQIAFCLDKFASFEIAFARAIEAAHGIRA